MGGLRRLEYRGYDSAGVALAHDGHMVWAKKAGKLANLDAVLSEYPLPASHTGIGHTRWATHGAPNDQNAHPHLDADECTAVVHNGIIENFAALREELEAAGHVMVSETDTEVVAHLLHDELNRRLADAPVASGSGASASGVLQSMAGQSEPLSDAQSEPLSDAVRAVCQRLEGAFTLVIADARWPEVVVGARRNSPLVVGRGVGENFLGSDVAAFIEYTREAIELGQDQVVTISAENITITDFFGAPVQTKPFHVNWDVSAAEKGGYDWFMLKEIAEQPQAVADTLLGQIGRAHV